MTDNTTKRSILSTMYQLIAEKGYDKASIGQISDAIGIKKASVYYYFKSKEDIFLELVQELFQNDYSGKLQDFERITSANGYQKELVKLGEDMIESYFANPELRKVYAEIDLQMTRIPAIKAFIKGNDEKFNRFALQIIARGVAVGAFPPDCNIALPAQILYTVLVGIDQAILYALPIDPKAVWREIVAKLLNGKVL
ncbi:MAG: TetR/AcrR family transcriptional regulator [Angelakisella sp.]